MHATKVDQVLLFDVFLHICSNNYIFFKLEKPHYYYCCWFVDN